MQRSRNLGRPYSGALYVTISNAMCNFRVGERDDGDEF